MNIAALTRHFFQDFFRLSFLDDAGEESFRRVIIGLLAGFVAFGLWLPRLYMGKYANAANEGSVERYRAMLLADQLLVISLPMFIVAFAMALVCHSLFPDETDYRILMPLPVSRLVIFSAKLLALLLFASLFIVTTNAAIGVPFSAVSTGRMATHYWPIRAVVQMTAGIVACTFAVSAIIAVQGLVVVLTPRAWLRSTSVIVQTLLVCGLVLLVPVILRLPAQATLLHARPAVFYLAPPVWFLGFQEFLLGNSEPYFVRLAVIASVGLAGVSGLAAGCYAIVYRRFDRVILRSEQKGSSGKSDAPYFDLASVRPEYRAVHAFTVKTLRRSGLHQLVFFGIAAAGLATAINSALNADSAEARRQTALWMPFVLIFASVLGLRQALLLPLNRHAAWIFRLTEDDRWRTHQLRVVEHVLITHAVLAPMTLVLPFQLMVLGARGTLLCLPLIFVMGLTLVEMILKRWQRIPFTCSYLPGKRPVTHEVLVLITAFLAFTSVGWGLAGRAVTRGSPIPVALLILLALAAAFRWLRIEGARNTPLEFEDELPESTYGLKLNS